MKISLRYMELRDTAIQNNATMGKEHPCRPGKGFCCETDLILSAEDQVFILEGIASHDITRELVSNATERAKKKSNTCPFLGDGKECTIYERRPLICIATGTMAIPTNAVDASIMSPETNSGREGLPFSRLSSSMCGKCHSTLARQGKGVSTQALIDSQAIGRHYSSGPTQQMSQFIKTLSVT